ncbi:hypothetical protein [Ekhidna sp.]
MNIITIAFIIILIALIVWVISSFTQFKKMDDQPDDYTSRRTFKSLSDGSDEI